MAGDGKALEHLVGTVEEIFLPQGCTVEARKLVLGDEGAKLAELDILISGRLGSTDMRWLIECRDRPSEGRAPAAWIEQLIGRRLVHGFNKVTAVSTTGFADGATQLAEKHGIETRTVSDLSPEDIRDWFLASHITFREHYSELAHAELGLPKEESDERVAAVISELQSKGTANIRLRSSKTGQAASMADAFSAAVHSIPGMPEAFDAMAAADPPRPVKVRARYPNDSDHYVLDTNLGPVRLEEIRFQGTISVRESEAPFAAIKEYKRDSSGAVISHSAAFAPVNMGGVQVTLEMHKVPETGFTHLVLRRTDAAREE